MDEDLCICSKVVLDVHARIFHTLHQVPPENFRPVKGHPGRLYSAVSGTEPCLVHGNGRDGKSMIKLFTEKFVQQGWIQDPPRSKK